MSFFINSFYSKRYKTQGLPPREPAAVEHEQIHGRKWR